MLPSGEIPLFCDGRDVLTMEYEDSRGTDADRIQPVYYHKSIHSIFQRKADNERVVRSDVHCRGSTSIEVMWVCDPRCRL